MFVLEQQNQVTTTKAITLRFFKIQVSKISTKIKPGSILKKILTFSFVSVILIRVVILTYFLGYLISLTIVTRALLHNLSMPKGGFATMESLKMFSLFYEILNMYNETICGATATDECNLKKLA